MSISRLGVQIRFALEAKKQYKKELKLNRMISFLVFFNVE
jgi:hypothetical protein